MFEVIFFFLFGLASVVAVPISFFFSEGEPFLYLFLNFEDDMKDKKRCIFLATYNKRILCKRKILEFIPYSVYLFIDFWDNVWVPRSTRFWISMFSLSQFHCYYWKAVWNGYWNFALGCQSWTEMSADFINGRMQSFCVPNCTSYCLKCNYL